MSRRTSNLRPVATVVVALGLGAALLLVRQSDDATDIAAPAGESTAPRAAGTVSIDVQTIAEALPDNAVWRPVDPRTVNPSRIPAYKEEVEGAVLVALDEAIGTWRVGDEIVIAVPQIDALYRPTIARLETRLGNNVSYVGRLLDGPIPRSFVITVGERNTFANLSTPEGDYELVGNTELAWLMPVANMDKHVDYSQPDVFITGGDEGPARPVPATR